MTLVAVSFSQSNPSTYPSLAPTLVTFMNMLDGTTIAGPGVTQLAGTGIYMFAHQTSTPFYFKMDAITTSTASDRYVYGVLGPIQQVDIQLTQLATTLASYNSSAGANFSTLTAYSVSLTATSSTLVAIGTTTISLIGTGTTNSAEILLRIGTTASSYGTTTTDPGDLYGFLKRNQEFLEGDQTFSKTSGVWNISTRGGTLIQTKTLSQTSSQVSKS